MTVDSEFINLKICMVYIYWHFSQRIKLYTNLYETSCHTPENQQLEGPRGRDPGLIRIIRAEIDEQIDRVDRFQKISLPLRIRCLRAPMSNKYSEGYPGASIT